MFGKIILTAVYLLAPAAVLKACRKSKLLGKIGPVLILYVLGIIIGNLGLIGVSLPPGTASIQDIMSSAAVPVAIPLMLLGCSFKKSETRSQLLALLTGMIAVIISVAIGYLVFHKGIDANGNGDSAAKIGGMLTGVYTGGTINLASLKTMLGVSDETYLLLNGYDMVVSFVYLMFLVAFGIKFFRKFLPDETAHDSKLEIGANGNPYKGLLTGNGGVVLVKLLGTVAVICGLSYVMTLIFAKAPFMTIFILSLTTFSIAASFIRKIRELPYAYDIGMYFIYIFSIVVASMADFSKLSLAGGAGMLGYLTLVIFGSLLLQVILAAILRIDSDTMVVSSVAFICSPPFVPMAAAAMRNDRVMVAGLSIGIIGYAAGNYLGYAIASTLPLVF